MDPETLGPDSVADRDQAMVERQLVCASIYNIAMFEKNDTELTDLLSETELFVDDDVRAELVAVGQASRAALVFAVYTNLHSTARGISPRNLTIVSDRAVYDELLEIAPNSDAPPGTSPIDLEILRSRTAPHVALQPAPASSSSAQFDLIRGEVEARKPY